MINSCSRNKGNEYRLTGLDSARAIKLVFYMVNKRVLTEI